MNTRGSVNILKLKLMISAGFVALAFTGACSSRQNDNSRIIHVGNRGEPNSLDPQQVMGSWEGHIDSDMFTGLFTVSADGKTIPALVTSYTISKDGLTWTFKLRDSKWSDGTPLTASDFVYSWQHLFSAKPATKYASLLFIIKNSQAIYEGKLPPSELGASAPDNKTLIVHLNYPAPYLPSLLTHNLSFPIPKQAVEKWGNQWSDPEHIIVNGAFKASEWVHGDFVRVIKNPSFFDAAHVCLNEIYYYPTSDEISAEHRVKNGSLDIETGFSGGRVPEIQRTMPGYLRIAPDLATTFYLFNQNKPPFNDTRVREALSMVIDREFITSDILRGQQTPAYGLVPPGVSNYDSGKILPSWAKLSHEERLKKARELLKQAGFGPNNPLHFSFTYRSGGETPAIVPVIQQNWGAIGDWVKVDMRPYELRIAYQKLRTGDFDVGDIEWRADFDDARNFLYVFETDSGQINFSHYSNQKFNDLMTTSDHEENINTRKSELMAAEKALLDDNAFIPVYFNTNGTLLNPRITGWTDNPANYHLSRYLCTKEALAAGK